MKKGSIVALIFGIVGIIVLLVGLNAEKTIVSQKKKYIEKKPEIIWNTLVQSNGTFMSKNKKENIKKIDEFTNTWTEKNEKNILYEYRLKQDIEKKELELTLVSSNIQLTGTWKIKINTKKSGSMVNLSQRLTCQKKWMAILITLSGKNTLLNTIFSTLEEK